MTTSQVTAPTSLKEGAQTIAQASTWTELVKAIDASDGIALVPMETLRKLEGAQRLGVHVLNSIGSRLGTLGLGHLPDTLPNRQDQDAILYRYGTPASEVISAVRTGLRNPTDVQNTYRALHKLNTLPDVADVVHREVLDEKLAEATKAIFDVLGQTGRSDVMNDMLGSLK
ncbi:MAG: hypothetical protein ABR585_12855 [Gemmatimonadaceae bacterium]|nr:hypothetical protein [Actinomycetota bacterium]